AKMLLVPDAQSTTYHLGELIPLKVGYTASVPGEFKLIGLSRKLKDGQDMTVQCSAEDGIIDRQKDNGEIGVQQFLRASCSGFGISGGFGSCSDCDTERLLGPEPIWKPFYLNYSVQFTRAGA